MVYRIIFPFFLFFSCLLSACQAPQEPEQQSPRTKMANMADGRFITAADYLTRHPEQIQISEQFNRIVQEPARPIIPDIQKQPVTIAFVYPGQQASDYWQRSVTSFAARMHELGIKFELKEFFSKGGGIEIKKQEQQLKDALDHDPDYLVFTLDVNRHQKLIERILARGKPHLILQNITTPLGIWEGNQPFYVGFDHAIGSHMLADYFLSKSNSNGQYGLLYYSQGYVSTMRGDTFRKYMREKNGPSLLGAYYTDGQRENAREATVKLLKTGKLDFIYACATDVALGAVDGLRDAGVENIMVNGWGGGSAELAALENGSLEVTVMRMNDDNGVAMAEAIKMTLLNKEDTIPTVYSGEFSLLTRDSSREQIKQLKKQAFRYSGMPPKQGT